MAPLRLEERLRSPPQHRAVDDALPEAQAAISGAGMLHGTGFDQDTLPASPETLLAAVRTHTDGTMAVGGLDWDGLQEDEAAAKPPEAPDTVEGADAQVSDAEDDDDIDGVAGGADVPGAPGSGLPGSAEPLPDEPWMSLPPHHRELWERVRPRAVRREAASVKELRMPNTVVSRLMKIHPDHQVRSSEALEIMNCSMVLLLQAVARAAVRVRASQSKVQFEDLRQACLNARELQFLQPLSGTLDASSRRLRAEPAAEVGAEGPEAAVASGPGSKPRGVRGGTAGPGPLSKGQNVLNASYFARASLAEGVAMAVEAVDDEAPEGNEAAREDAEPTEEVTPVGKDAGRKRAAAESSASARKAPSKVPRKAATNGKKVSGGPSLASMLFRRPGIGGD